MNISGPGSNTWLVLLCPWSFRDEQEVEVLKSRVFKQHCGVRKFSNVTVKGNIQCEDRP